jgi:hypothetical protein
MRAFEELRHGGRGVSRDQTRSCWVGGPAPWGGAVGIRRAASVVRESVPAKTAVTPRGFPYEDVRKRCWAFSDPDETVGRQCRSPGSMGSRPPRRSHGTPGSHETVVSARLALGLSDSPGSRYLRCWRVILPRMSGRFGDRASLAGDARSGDSCGTADAELCAVARETFSPRPPIRWFPASPKRRGRMLESRLFLREPVRGREGDVRARQGIPHGRGAAAGVVDLRGRRRRAVVYHCALDPPERPLCGGPRTPRPLLKARRTPRQARSSRICSPTRTGEEQAADPDGWTFPMRWRPSSAPSTADRSSARS